MSWVFVPKQHAIYTRHVSRINEELPQISHCEVTQGLSEYTDVDKLDGANRIGIVTY